MDAAVQIAQAHIADGIGVLGNGLDDGAVGSLHKGRGLHPFTAHDKLVPAFKGAGRGIAAHDNDFAVLAAKFLPVGNLAGVDIAQLLGGQVLDGVFGMDNRDNGVIGDGCGNGPDVPGFGSLLFLVLHVAGAHGHGTLPLDEGLDAVAGTAAGNGKLDVRMGGHEGFAGLLHDGKHCGGTIDDELAGLGRCGHGKAENGTCEDFAKRHTVSPCFTKNDVTEMMSKVRTGTRALPRSVRREFLFPLLQVRVGSVYCL